MLDKDKIGYLVNKDGLVLYRCRNCHELYVAKSRNYKPTCNTECATERLIESIKAMMDKKGPMYEKWRMRMEAAKMHQQRMKGGLTHRGQEPVRPAH